MSEVLIFLEPAYSGSMWCQNLLDGLLGVLKLKRIPYRIIGSLKEIRENRYIFLIGSNNTWVKAVLRACNEIGTYPILLCNQTYHKFNADYSAICSDVAGSMKHLVGILDSMKRKRIALYGVNPQSVSDEGRKDSFLVAMGGRGRRDIFINNGSLQQCFARFLLRAQEYDTAICTNDFAAISLVRHLKEQRPELLDRLTIIGCAEARLTGHYADRIHSVRLNFEEYGKAAVVTLGSLQKTPCISNIVMMIKWDCSAIEKLQPGRSEKTEIKKPALPVEMQCTETFYNDDELREMMLVERLLCECTEVERLILRKIMEGSSYEKIAEECFLMEGTIKYHVKKMGSLCRVNGKRQLVELLRKYLLGSV